MPRGRVLDLLENEDEDSPETRQRKSLFIRLNVEMSRVAEDEETPD